MAEAALPQANHALIDGLRSALAEAADSTKAPNMQRYMKSEMPYRGVTTPELRRIQKVLIASHPIDGWDAWHDTALLLWRTAEYREERYAAIGVTGAKQYGDYQTRRALPMYEEMIVAGAWWDYVDTIAGARLGNLIRRYPKWMKHRMRQWSTNSDMWKRRSSIICQLGFKADIDLELLYACIEPNMADKEFFIRKAIGWALRQHAWTDPHEVVRYVTANADRLSGLSKREALKNVLKAGTIDVIP
jgi:3-methyladenine DNA glycosylase AlkD